MPPNDSYAQPLWLVALILLSGFFSAGETALFSISKVRARHLAKVGGRREKLIKEMKDDPHRLLSTILIGNNLVNVAAASLATAYTIKLVSYHAVGIATGIMTFVLLVFGEILPKSVATRNNVLIARLVIVPIRWFSILVLPITLLLNFIPRLTAKIQQKARATEQELMTYVEMVEEEGEIEKEEKQLIENIFKLDDTRVSAIMTPRPDMFVLRVDKPVNVDELLASGVSRIPIVDGGIDHVVGVLNIRDLFAVRSSEMTPATLRQLAREPHFVPENVMVDSLLHAFRERKEHIAIVIDEYGGVAGLVTLEDVLEEIVGEIIDETDTAEPNIVVLNEDEWLVRARCPIDELNEAIPMNVPESHDYDTFSGYVLQQLQHIPKETEELNVGDFVVTVKKAFGPKIREYLVSTRAQ